mgnify:CR=1 FL=1
MNIPTPAVLDRPQVITELDSQVLAAQALGMPVHVFVDESNIAIGGRRVHAVATGYAGSVPDTFGMAVLPEWRLSYGALYRLLVPRPEALGSAKLYGSFDRAHGGPVTRLSSAAGFDSYWFPRMRGHEKRVDVSLALAVAEVVYTGPPPLVVLASGDGDYLPVVETVRKHGGTVVTVGWVGTISGRLAAASDAVINLGPWLTDLEHRQSAPVGACC